MEQKIRINLRGSICEMEVGDELHVSAEDFAYTTIRSTCSEMGWQLRRRYKSHRNTEDYSYTITRLS